MKKCVAVLLAFLVSISCIAFSGCSSVDSLEGKEQKSAYYKYPYTTDDSSWKSFTSHDAMINACRIPQETLDKMTTEQLVQAVADFPLLGDIYFYDDNVKAERIKENSDAFRELCKRSDGEKYLSEKIEKIRTPKEKDKAMELDALSYLLEYLQKDNN